jgi:hypothetical protein
MNRKNGVEYVCLKEAYYYYYSIFVNKSDMCNVLAM